MGDKLVFSLVGAFSVIATVCGLTIPAQHFGAPCQLCECFVTYTDRDVNQFTQPYQVLNASFAYEATEDRCLAHCMNEEQCRLVVYGYVGGRDVFACEFYRESTVRTPLYTPFTNIYIKRTSECKKQALGYEALETADADARTSQRKMRYLRLYQKFNFFGFG
uniref:Apple domain-containing protein n=1 Tax=Globodera pallida TaxID=36090 RepID=A0A183CAW4_GLOPA